MPAGNRAETHALLREIEPAQACRQAPGQAPRDALSLVAVVGGNDDGLSLLHDHLNLQMARPSGNPPPYPADSCRRRTRRIRVAAVPGGFERAADDENPKTRYADGSMTPRPDEAPMIAVPALRSVVLAGGASRRMGSDKALLGYHGVPQVRHLAGMLESIASPVFVSARKAQLHEPAFEGLRLLVDPVEGIGPLAGLLAAFAREPDCAWMAVAVDMPWITAATLERLRDARDQLAYATAYRIPETDLPEPVCAIYEPRIAPLLLRAQAEGRYSLMLLRDVPIRLVDPAESRELQGVNDPDEYEAARKASPEA
jgi:molybdopterin-guanine dinucleotide biosynthesis protein A